ncbi:MAG: hypothetical protein IJE97_03105 [Thermoguttaceae bacterium]|nr:hypothetical protein [Thermoguttaceae bacterium]MBQ7111212.1 hypothetical protein [Thermoguttaceae bacterium]
MIFALSIGSAVSSLLSWFADIFSSLWNACVDLFKWLGVKIYNIVLEVIEFMFEALVDAFIFLLDFFPDLDLSALDDGLSTLLEFLQGLNQFLPLSESFFCVNFLFAYFTIFAVVRTVVKLIPTIG